MEDTIRRVLAEHAKLTADPTSVESDADLYALGLTSHASVNVMLGLEDALGIEFPDALLRKGTFQSIASIAEAVRGITGAHA